MKIYTSLIADIKNSKDYNRISRNRLQEYLTKCIDVLNGLFKEQMACKVAFSAGDEFQGLFHDTCSAIMYLRLMEILVFPVHLRAGIGIGEWTIRVESGLSTEQDGPAYHNARDAIKEVYKMQAQNFRIRSGSGDDILSNHLLNVSQGLIMMQNNTQNMMQLITEVCYPFTNQTLSVSQIKAFISLIDMKRQYENIRKTEDFPDKTSQFQIDGNYLSVIEQIPITDSMEEPEKMIIKKNMSGNIAKIMNKTRQNIDTVMRRGKIVTIRGMDYIALQYIKQYYGGK